MSRLATALPISADATSSDDDAIASLVTALQTLHDDLVTILNGQIELVENYGYEITGTTNAAANGLNTVGHALGRVPKFILLMAETPGVPPLAHNFYWYDTERAAWTDSVVTFRCTTASIPYRGYVI